MYFITDYCDGGCIAVRLFYKKQTNKKIHPQYEIHRSTKKIALQPV